MRVLERLGVCLNEKILRAAVVLFGKRFLPDFPQCELKMARFRGVDKTEFLDQKQIHGPAFKLLEEGMLFCNRHLPLPGRIESGRLERVDRPLIPPNALREILVNALIHRDYAFYGGSISLAIFDDRVDIWSAGKLPVGISPEALSKEHNSVRRNLIIADVFYRAGMIENWGRGTNRVIDQCREAGISTPEFREVGNFTVVTFRVSVGQTAQATPQVIELLKIAKDSRTREERQRAVGLKDRKHFQKTYLDSLLIAGWLEMTIPDKPQSRLQKYRITRAGIEIIKNKKGE